MSKGKPIQNAQDLSDNFFELVSSCEKQKDYKDLHETLQTYPTLLTSQDRHGKNILHKIADGTFGLEVLREIERYIEPQQVIALYRGKANGREGLIKRGDTPLITAAWENDVPLMEELLNSQDRIFQKINYDKADLQDERKNTVRATGRNGQTALHVAAVHSNPKMAIFLRENDAELQMRDTSGNMAFHTAVRINLAKHDKSATKAAHDNIKVMVPLLVNNAKDLETPIVDKDGRNCGDVYDLLSRVNKWDSKKDTAMLGTLCDRSYEDKRVLDQPVKGPYTAKVIHQRQNRSSGICAIL